MRHQTYLKLLAEARRHSRRAAEAEDLLHTILLAAIEVGRGDMSCPKNRRWLRGALRNRAAFEARSAIRRRARDAHHLRPADDAAADPPFPDHFLTGLPRALRTTALLALTGHTRPEIRHLLGLSDAALRQRIAQIRQRWRALGHDPVTQMTGLATGLPFGLIRQALHAPVTQTPDVHLGSHDPDGHLFILGPAHKIAPHGNL